MCMVSICHAVYICLSSQYEHSYAYGLKCSGAVYKLVVTRVATSSRT